MYSNAEWSWVLVVAFSDSKVSTLEVNNVI